MTVTSKGGMFFHFECITAQFSISLKVIYDTKQTVNSIHFSKVVFLRSSSTRLYKDLYETHKHTTAYHGRFQIFNAWYNATETVILQFFEDMQTWCCQGPVPWQLKWFWAVLWFWVNLGMPFQWPNGTTWVHYENGYQDRLNMWDHSHTATSGYS